MTPCRKRLTAVTRRMAEGMRIRNLAQATIDAYTHHVGRFGEFLGGGRDFASAGPEDVRSFPLHLLEVRKVGWGALRRTFRRRFRTGLNRLYEHGEFRLAGRMAAWLVIEQVARGLVNQIPIGGLHDGIFCRPGDSVLVGSAFHETFEELGILMLLKSEHRHAGRLHRETPSRGTELSIAGFTQAS